MTQTSFSLSKDAVCILMKTFSLLVVIQLYGHQGSPLGGLRGLEPKLCTENASQVDWHTAAVQIIQEAQIRNMMQHVVSCRVVYCEEPPDLPC